MAAGNFIKDNLALVAGIAVPVVLVAGFLLTSVLGRALTPPPAHSAYFVIKNYDADHSKGASLSLDIASDGTLTAKLTPVKGNADYHPNTITDVLLSYDARTGKTTTHDIVVPDGLRNGTFVPAEFKTLRLSAQPEAPDGYRVTHGSYNRAGIIGDIFTYRTPDGYRIRKGAATYRLPQDLPAGTNLRAYHSYNLRFLGWNTEAAQ